MITGATQTKGVGGFYSFFGIDQKCAGEGLDHYVFDQRIGQLSSQQFWQKLRQLSFSSSVTCSANSNSVWARSIMHPFLGLQLLSNWHYT